MGVGSVVSNNGCVAIGEYNQAIGDTSFAFGILTTSSAYASFTTGSMTSANNTSSGAFGQGTIANGYAEFVMGMMNKELPVLDDYEESPGYYVINPMESVFQVGNGDPFLGIRSNAITTRKNGETTLSNKYWVATTPTSISTSPVSSGGKALVVEGHTELKGNTLLQGDVTIAQPQGDISMGIYQ